MAADFDAIVVGSGITGGWAGKELTERGLKVLMVERGPNLEHRRDYSNEFKSPWETPFRGEIDPAELHGSKRIQRHGRMTEWAAPMFVDDNVDVYETPADSGFRWIRGYHLGGRSLMWGRHCYRLSDLHLSANAKDGHGIDWPIRYADLAPWYDYVERCIGVNGTVDGMPTLPDGIYQPTMGLNKAEQKWADAIKARYRDRRLLPGRVANLTEAIGERTACQHRDQCMRGCSFGAYFSTQSSTLPAARATGRLTLRTDTIVESLDFDADGRRVSGVRVHDLKTGARSVLTAKAIFLCAGSVNSVSVLLRSRGAVTPDGLGNSSGLLGRFLMDHAFSSIAFSTVPGLDDQYHRGRKPNGTVVPRFVNVDRQETDFLRGYSYQGGSGRQGWSRGVGAAGIGAEFKQSLRGPGGWGVGVGTSIECLPRPTNTIAVNFNRRDKYDLPLTRLDLRWSDNEFKAAAHAKQEAVAMLSLLGGFVFDPGGVVQPPGTSIHEMGGACMGRDPRGSVTNAWNQLHDAPNVFCTDGAAMCSTGDRNPSLTYMALTVRAAAHAVDLLRSGAL